jgi:hypothetical protein
MGVQPGRQTRLHEKCSLQSTLKKRASAWHTSLMSEAKTVDGIGLPPPPPNPIPRRPKQGTAEMHRGFARFRPSFVPLWLPFLSQMRPR